MLSKTSKKFGILEPLTKRIYRFYENWILPPQNESLVELKRREFREKTKYLDPKVLYTLTDEEKTGKIFNKKRPQRKGLLCGHKRKNVKRNKKI